MMMSVVTYLNIALVVSLHVIRSGATFDPVMDIKNKELLDSAKQRPGGLVVYFGPADVLEEKKSM